MCQFAQSYQSGLEDVLFEALVGDAAPDTVLAEARCLDAQGAQQRQDGAVHIAVALELDDDQRPHIGSLACLEVLELHVKVDGQPLGLPIVHQRDAVEAVLHGGVDAPEPSVH